MFTLKNYQQDALDTLVKFFTRSLDMGSVADAYSSTLNDMGIENSLYRHYSFGEIPYVCFRIPTGGGKTLMASYSVEIFSKHYLQQDYPITLWLVPTNIIRQQTVDALKKPGHPYRRPLEKYFGGQLMVLDVEEVTQIRAHDINTKAIIIVSTLANLRVNDTAGRKVYSHHEAFEPHFVKIPHNHPSLDVLEKIESIDIQNESGFNQEIGKIKYSFANLLALHHPLVIIDEAHNARTSLTFDTLKRIHPAAIVEFTATPNMSSTNGSNILYHVSAAELKAEEMIKLPILLTEHKSWQDALRDAVLTRNQLTLEAQKEHDYIRPIVLIQAENKNGEVTVEVIKEYLIKELKIDGNKIAIATGTQKELDGINLFDPTCLIEYIITMEALKEGWDCSFAYIFFSAKKLSSSKDAEQLLGRVLRMPYAKKRISPELNKAYAHLATDSFTKVASELTDKLITMGFEEIEVANYLVAGQSNILQADLFSQSSASLEPNIIRTMVIETDKELDLTQLVSEDAGKISIKKVDDKCQIHVTGEISESMQSLFVSHLPKAEKERVVRDIRIYNQAQLALKSPSQRGMSFAPIPQLCVMVQGELELVESELFLQLDQWNLLNYPAKLENFRQNEDSLTFSIDVSDKNKKVSYRCISQQETHMNLNNVDFQVTETDLVRWLDSELRQPDISQLELIQFLSKLVKNTIAEQNTTLTALVRHKYPLARAIKDLINIYRKKAQKSGIQSCLFSNDYEVETCFEYAYTFGEEYPARWPYYDGRYKFQKHYYPIIEDLKSSGEEFECAKVLDLLPEVKYWVRNLVKRDHASFSIPLSDRRFYPDFIAELNDGRIFVVEYKGEAYKTNDDSAEKRQIGNLWASKSSDKCLFLMAVKQDNKGRGVFQQLKDVVSN